MAQVSISEAARLAGISRSNLYKNYVRTGKISVTKGHQDRPQVDTAEILRVFGGLQGDSSTLSTEIQEDTPEKGNADTVMEAMNRSLMAQLDDAKEREAWYREQIGELSAVLADTRKLLEHQLPAPRPWWRLW